MQTILAIFKTMRPRQWTKNILFVFPGIVFDGQLFEFSAGLRVIATALLLIVISGTVYIINDLVDIENDRANPKKRNRPLPSGQLSVRAAIVASIILPAIALVCALFLDRYIFVILVWYLILQIAYSFYLKNIVLLDILAVTAGFVLRIAAGAIVIRVENFSPWLYVCGGLLALFLIIGKRRQELIELGETASSARPVFQEYNLPLLNNLLQMVMTSTLITYTLYTLEAPTRRVADTSLALLTVPFVVYALFRYSYLIHVRNEGSAPDEVLLKDRPLQVVIVLFSLLFIILLYFLPSAS